jgi:hypothetical protein
MNPKAPERPRDTDRNEADWLDVVHRKVDALRFGSVQIIVHEGRVTQIESLEKTRFQSTRDDSGAH